MTQRESVLAQKAELRAAALARRDALPPAVRAAAAEALAARDLPVEPKAELVVSGFMPIRSEINPLPLLRQCAELGARLALPRMVGRDRALVMHAWAPGEALVKGLWGIREPAADAPEVEPDVVLVPLAAFDRRGHRLGYGAGYYDRTLLALRANKAVLAVGVAYAMQEVDKVPVLPHDAPLDLVLTERETIDCRGA